MESVTLGRLMSFSQSLANALDRPTLQHALATHLPTFSHERAFWVTVRKNDGWDMLLQDAKTRDNDPQDACFPLVVGGAVVGVLGVSSVPALTEEEQSAMGAAAALVAIGVKNMQLFLETRELSLRDGLTGCFNRRHGLETLDVELRRSRRTGSALSVLMFDVDRFKNVNDRFGHLRGDEVLAAVGAQLRQTLRVTDISCRYGGDEFLVILPDTALPGAERVAEGLRQAIANTASLADKKYEPVTISVGVAAAIPGELDAKAVIHRADEALYQTKSGGRNGVSIAIHASIAGAAHVATIGALALTQ